MQVFGNIKFPFCFVLTLWHQFWELRNFFLIPFRDDAVSTTEPSEWISRFKSFQIMICDFESSGRPSSSRTDINVTIRYSDRALWNKLFSRYQLNAQNFLIDIILHSSTCFEQQYAHPQEIKLYIYSIWYRHSMLGGRRGLGRGGQCTKFLYSHNITFLYIDFSKYQLSAQFF